MCLQSLIKPTMMKHSLKELSLRLRHWYKTNYSELTDLHIPKKYYTLDPPSRWCSRFFPYFECLPQGQIANCEYYKNVLQRLPETVRRKRLELRWENSFFTHYYNALVTQPCRFSSFGSKIRWLFSHSLSSPLWFFLFSILKSVPKGYRFNIIDDRKPDSSAVQNI